MDLSSFVGESSRWNDPMEGASRLAFATTTIHGTYHFAHKLHSPLRINGCAPMNGYKIRVITSGTDWWTGITIADVRSGG